MGRSPHTRYLAQVALFFALSGVLLPGYVELFPENVFPQEYTVWRSQFDFAGDRDTPPVERIVLGDSRVLAAALPGVLGPKARSLALGGATAIEVYYLLRRHLAHHPPPRAAVISFAPFHLEGAKWFWERAVKWKALEAGEVFEVFRRAESLGDSRTLGDDSRRRLVLRWLGYRANLPAIYAPELRASRLLGRRRGNLRNMDELEADAGHYFFGRRETSSGPASEVGHTAFNASPLIDVYLRDTFALAEEHGIAVVFAAMPVNRTSFQGLRPSFLADYRTYVAHLARDHPGVRFAAEPWVLPDDHFGDPGHVNRRGAQVVSERLAALLAEEARGNTVPAR
jgi:hypothetical protein